MQIQFVVKSVVCFASKIMNGMNENKPFQVGLNPYSKMNFKGFG